VGPPEPAGRGLVRVTKAFDWHAVAFRERSYLKVRRVLARLRGGRPGLPSNDQRVAELQREMPTYAAWPNLAWQRINPSDLTKGIYSAYRPDGEQAVNRENIAGLQEKMDAAYGPHGGLVWSGEGGGGVLLTMLRGGLGEQMFQYAAALSLSRETGRRLVAAEGVKVENESGAAVAAAFTQRSKNRRDSGGTFLRSVLREVFEVAGTERLEPEERLEEWRHGREPGREELLARVNATAAGVYGLGGWFADEDYFGRHAEEVRSVFRPEPAPLSLPAGRVPVAMEVRRDTPRDYLERAAKIIQVLVPDAQFVVTGHTERCRGVLPEGRWQAVGCATEADALRVMAGCRAHILAGTALGWWAAWLARAEHVIRPLGLDADGEPAWPARWLAVPAELRSQLPGFPKAASPQVHATTP